METKIKSDTTLNKLHSLVYTAACTILALNKQEVKNIKSVGKKRLGQNWETMLPTWQKSLED